MVCAEEHSNQGSCQLETFLVVGDGVCGIYSADSSHFLLFFVFMHNHAWPGAIPCSVKLC